MSRLIIFIPKGQSEPVTVRIHHQPDLPLPGIWNIVTNEVYLRTEIWNQFVAGDQPSQRKLFDQLLRLIAWITESLEECERVLPVMERT